MPVTIQELLRWMRHHRCCCCCCCPTILFDPDACRRRFLSRPCLATAARVLLWFDHARLSCASLLFHVCCVRLVSRVMLLLLLPVPQRWKMPISLQDRTANASRNRKITEPSPTKQTGKVKSQARAVEIQPCALRAGSHSWSPPKEKRSRARGREGIMERVHCIIEVRR